MCLLNTVDIKKHFFMGLPCHECAGLIGHGANLTVNAPVTVTAPAVRPIPLSFSQPLANSQILALFHDVPLPRSARPPFSAN